MQEAEAREPAAADQFGHAGGAQAPAPARAAPETPSGKGAKDENFPVGSFLLPAHLRPHVAKFYAFARAADDIADNRDLEPLDKIERLNGFEAALLGEAGDEEGFEKAHALRESLAEVNVTPQHGVDLLSAFRQDAVKLRYANWQELMDYCALSANPVGRYLLDLHGEDPRGYVQSDALCTVLQVLNHMQDCADDQRTLHRVYIPEDWMGAEGASSADLSNGKLTPGMRRVLDRMLEGTDALLAQADQLSSVLKSRHLAMESAVIVHLAHRLSDRLRTGDPLATRVKLSKLDFAWCGITGMFKGFFGAKQHS